MAKGDFGKAYGLYRQKGGTLDRRGFADEVWNKTLDKTTLMQVKTLEAIENGEVGSGREVLEDSASRP